MPHRIIDIRPLTPAGRPDFLSFFEGEAFADNPKWGSCFCQYLYVDHQAEHWPGRTGEQNRAAACTRIDAGTMPGWLAWRDGRPVGWCSAGPRPLMTALATEPCPGAEPAEVGQIGCFVVAPAHRRTGVARALLQAAVAGFRDQGLRFADAMPFADARTEAAMHHGPLALFLAEGFTPLRQDGGRVWVRRALQG